MLFRAYEYAFEQAKPETVEKVCDIVKKQLAVSEGQTVTAESTFQKLGADSLDTVRRKRHGIVQYITRWHLYLPSYITYAMNNCVFRLNIIPCRLRS